MTDAVVVLVGSGVKLGGEFTRHCPGTVSIDSGYPYGEPAGPSETLIY